VADGSGVVLCPVAGFGVNGVKSCALLQES